MLEAAATQFALTGLHGTTTAALAKAAGISEPVLYLNFDSKDRLFRDAVEQNIGERLRTLRSRLAFVAGRNPIECIARMAEATVIACVSGRANAILTNWALLEAPEYAIDLHRQEAGAVCLMWEHQLNERYPESWSSTISIGLVHQAAHACLAYGLWLAALRHTRDTAAALAGEFAERVAQATAALTC